VSSFKYLLGLAAAFSLLLSGCFSNSRNQGERLYATNCASCHGDQGQGLARLIPPLAGADYLATHRDELPCLLRHGQSHAIVVNGVSYQQVMPGNAQLSPSQLTNLLNYIESHWGNQSPAPRTIPEVQQQLQLCPQH
jgi:mono/diheme cytochrome c family protein